MQTVDRSVLAVFAGLCLVVVLGGAALIHSGEPAEPAPAASDKVVFLTAAEEESALQRPPAVFNHDAHTGALDAKKPADCKACHTLEVKDPLTVTTEKVTVYTYPKGVGEEIDTDALMEAYHAQCVACHAKRTAEGKKSGPRIGLCGQCHVRRPAAQKVEWQAPSIFNYVQHAKHVKATDKKCETCHHIYDEKTKKLIYKKNTENACSACHKDEREKNVRSLRKVAHAQCITCHMDLIAKGENKHGPVKCDGCHQKPKELTQQQIATTPRLDRGQKDVINITLKDDKTARMKTVAFNHKIHERQGQFCTSCHHYSLEKCSNCHTVQPNFKKGGGVTYERAFHRMTSDKSCVGCHDVAKQEPKCKGCHQWKYAELKKESCSVCHTGPLPEGEMRSVPPLPLVFDKEKVPADLKIKVLEKQFKPAAFPHQKIVKKLTEISNKSELARVFHAVDQQTLCAGCHHNVQLASAKKVPECRSCHGRPFSPADPGMLGTLAAYHQQCMGCHQAMNQKPMPLECAKCHPNKEGALQTANRSSIPYSGIEKTED